MKAEILPVNPLLSGGSDEAVPRGLSVHHTIVLGAFGAVGLVIFVAVSGTGMGLFLSLTLGLLPLLGAAGYFLTLVVGRPRGFSRDWFDWLALRMKQDVLWRPSGREEGYEL